MACLTASDAAGAPCTVFGSACPLAPVSTSSALTSPPPTRLLIALLVARLSAVDLILCKELGSASTHLVSAGNGFPLAVLLHLVTSSFMYLPSLRVAFSKASQEPTPVAYRLLGAVALTLKCQTRVFPICSWRS